MLKPCPPVAPVPPVPPVAPQPVAETKTVAKEE